MSRTAGIEQRKSIDERCIGDGSSYFTAATFACTNVATNKPMLFYYSFWLHERRDVKLSAGDSLLRMMGANLPPRPAHPQVGTRACSEVESPR
jgi:hypothetical protein